MVVASWRRTPSAVHMRTLRSVTERLGIREMRSKAAALVRRAGSGERIVITVGGARVNLPEERVPSCARRPCAPRVDWSAGTIRTDAGVRAHPLGVGQIVGHALRSPRSLRGSCDTRDRPSAGASPERTMSAFS